MDPMFPDYKPNKISNSLSMSLCPLPHRQRGTGKRFIRNESVDEPADPPCIPILLGHSWPLEQDSVEQDVFFILQLMLMALEEASGTLYTG